MRLHFVQDVRESQTAAMKKQFTQIHWDDALADHCRQLVRLAVREDLEREVDWTTPALIPREAVATATIVSRAAGVAAGLATIELLFEEMDIQANCRFFAQDGDSLSKDAKLVELSMSARDLLTAERLILNFVGHLSGIATLTRKFVEAVAGAEAKIYDTRKTTPGWRRLEKYAVRCGGGCNHRSGLFDAVLIKDNHLAIAAAQSVVADPAKAVELARQFLVDMSSRHPDLHEMIVEVEVDTLDQLRDVLPADPDVILLDNMTPPALREAVALRNQLNSSVELEASGGITLDNVRDVADTGVERISIGAITHSAQNLDVGLDWEA